MEIDRDRFQRARENWAKCARESPKASIRLFPCACGYAGVEEISAVEAEEAIQFELLRENDLLSTEQAKRLAADLVQNGRNLHVLVTTNAHQRHYEGRDLFVRPRLLGCL